ncbi:hypothetical protein GCM10010168_76300 [Actinoplanes ianthinogenes]|uniref:Uncharacterized protein n=1 Tax=Actinoplanes ianthinogenes TaxID=122358 RepID=A0ABM7MA09_9ACTN|nr:hypothetical protein [Actinoplanes ianthinogenes]BCJ48444.1 hypothetical protein Aiant_91010 [Actinoplanes ianthinogenes]GGR46330.1 hypothetical protein GCM10010168_76300 [Actinoplanes ianthinogenes]
MDSLRAPRMLAAAVVIVAASLPLAMSPPAARAQAAPDGRIPLSVLREATLDVPAWPADDLQGPSGRVRFHLGEAPVEPRTVPDGRPPYGDTVTILAVTYGDVDHDGVDETIVVLGCLIEGGSKQIVAYDRDPAGAIVLLGRVAATTGEVRDIRNAGVRVGDTGVVTAPVADYQRCCADATPQIWQTRGYALRHDRFVQVSGPTRMPVNPHVTETRVSAGPLTLGPPDHGYRYGTVDVTVTHRRGAVPRQVSLLFYPPAGLRRTGDWPKTTAEPDSFSVTVAAPPAGGSVTHTFAFRRPAAATGGELPIGLATIPELNPAIPWSVDTTAPIR